MTVHLLCDPDVMYIIMYPSCCVVYSLIQVEYIRNYEVFTKILLLQYYVQRMISVIFLP